MEFLICKIITSLKQYTTILENSVYTEQSFVNFGNILDVEINKN